MKIVTGVIAFLAFVLSVLVALAGQYMAAIYIILVAVFFGIFSNGE